MQFKNALNLTLLYCKFVFTFPRSEYSWTASICDIMVSLWEGIQISKLLHLNEEVYLYNIQTDGNFKWNIFSTVMLATKFVGMMYGVL